MLGALQPIVFGDWCHPRMNLRRLIWQSWSISVVAPKVIVFDQHMIKYSPDYQQPGCLLSWGWRCGLSNLLGRARNSHQDPSGPSRIPEIEWGRHCLASGHSISAEQIHTGVIMRHPKSWRPMQFPFRTASMWQFLLDLPTCSLRLTLENSQMISNVQ